MATLLVSAAVLLAACTGGSGEASPSPPATASAAADPDGPVPPGAAARVGDYEITVLGVEEARVDDVLRENELNDPPAPGSVFLMFRLRAAFVGEGGGLFSFDTVFEALGPGGEVYDRPKHGCGYVPDDITYQGQTFPGDAIEGNACREVPEDQVDRLQVRMRPYVEPDEPGVVFDLPPAG